MLTTKKTKFSLVSGMMTKVINFCSSTNKVGMGTIKHQVRNEKKEFKCPWALIQCQRHMLGINEGNQMRTQGGKFGNQVHFKQWHKKVHLAILDCGPLNTRNAWNPSAEAHSFCGRRSEQHEFCNCIAQTMCNCCNPTELDGEDAKPPALASTFEEESGHIVMLIWNSIGFQEAKKTSCCFFGDWPENHCWQMC